MKKAFTLIELLVVIAILAIIASIQLPILAWSRQEAMTVKCASNLRGCGEAALNYMDDFNNHFPVYDEVESNFVSGATRSCSWADNLMRTGYLEVGTCLVCCPADCTKPKVGYNGTTGTYAFMEHIYGCIDPWELESDYVLFDGAHRYLLINALKTPSAIFLVADSWGKLQNINAPTFLIDVRRPGQFHFWMAHKELCNKMYIDGHAGFSASDPVDLCQLSLRMPLNANSNPFQFYTQNHTRATMD